MSRIGKLPIAIPQGVKVLIEPSMVTVEGPRGKLVQNYLPEVAISMSGDQLIVTKITETRQGAACFGLYRSLLKNMVTGVSAGFKRNLLINGVGYRAEIQGEALVLSLGYSTDFYVAIPQGIKVAIESNGLKIVLEGADKAAVGKFASEIRSFRAPEPYKGKGIRYEEEQVRKKVGKTGVK